MNAGVGSTGTKGCDRLAAKALQGLLEERALAHDAMDASRVARVREEMDGNVLILTIDYPSRKNAIAPAVRAALEDALVPIMTGGMGVDISTAALALEGGRRVLTRATERIMRSSKST